MYASRRFTLKVELRREEDGRWIADVVELPGVLVYASSPDDAIERARELAAKVISDRLDHGENPI